MAASNDTGTLVKPQSGAAFSGADDQVASGASIDPADVARFSAQAALWWDARGPFAPLHKFNPSRLAFVRDRVAERFGRNARERAPFRGLSLIDIGCGGGLLSEPMSRMGFDVTAIDASSENIGTARAHAGPQGLPIAYRAATVEQMEAAMNAGGAGPFDVVLTMEVIEHVADPEAFVRACSRLVAPGGMMIVATLNRSLKGLLLGKIAAELRPALGARRDPRLAPVSQARRDPAHAVAGAGRRHRPLRPRLRPVDGPLGGERRYGHQLYDDRDPRLRPDMPLDLPPAPSAYIQTAPARPVAPEGRAAVAGWRRGRLRSLGGRSHPCRRGGCRHSLGQRHPGHRHRAHGQGGGLAEAGGRHGRMDRPIRRHRRARPRGPAADLREAAEPRTGPDCGYRGQAYRDFIYLAVM
jgi:2-polyprenyl-6-hydroxyphenyl methylase/3-demethylubiquinone-9 3-methyltransferase